MIVKIKLTPSEYELARAYSDSKNRDLSELMLDIYLNKAVDDLTKGKTYSHEEVKKMFNL